MRMHSRGGLISKVTGTLLLVGSFTSHAWAGSSEEEVVRASKVLLEKAQVERGRGSGPIAFEIRADLLSLRTRNVWVRVPKSAELPITIDENVSGMHVALSLDGAFDAVTSRKLHDGAVGQVLRSSEQSLGVTVIPRANGFEDFVLYEHAPSSARLSYRVRLTRVAGLRQLGNVLELLDREGAPDRKSVV